MSFRRYEILLPTKYNDGSPVEQRKFLQTYREIAAQFGAVSFEGVTHGMWIREGQTHEGTHRNVVVNVEDNAETEAFFVQFKQRLIERFRQTNIWSVSYEIRIAGLHLIPAAATTL